MNPRFLSISAAAIATLGFVACSQQAPGQSAARTFHVDFAKGSDDNAGTSPDRAWKHAPGDPTAGGKPAALKLGAGDRVVFAPGVAYRGTIEVTARGAPNAPIVFEGGPGAEAIINGSDPIRTTPCPSAAACAGHPQWQRLVLLRADSPLDARTILFADKGMMRVARAPDPKDDFYADEVAGLEKVQPARLFGGSVPLPPQITTPFPGAALSLWVMPNVITTRPITNIGGGVATFDPTGVRFYRDRDGAAAIVNHPQALDRPGEFVLLPDGASAVAMLPPGARSVEAASGRPGFVLNGAANIVIRNLTFEHMTDGGKPGGGVAIGTKGTATQGVEIANNRFRDMTMPRGQGPIIMRASGLRIHDNRIDRIVAGSGMRLSSPSSDIVVERNRIEKVGRTAIMLMGVSNATVQNNFITDVKGVHGNGLSAYLDNHQVKFIANTVLDAKQPVTFHGRGADKPFVSPNDLVFAENFLVATPDALGSLISWGAEVRGARLERNVMLGGRFGLRLNAKDQDIVAENNIGTPPTRLQPPAGWRIDNNDWVKDPRWGNALIASVRAAGEAMPRPAAAAGDAKLCGQIFGRTTPGQVGATLNCAR